MESKRVFYYKLLAIGVGLLAVCLTLELAIRCIDEARGRGFFTKHRQRVTGSGPTVPFRMFGFTAYQTSGGTRYISSSHRERYPLSKPPGALRIVCFGGSTTEDSVSYRSDRIHYPGVLQERLRERLPGRPVEVINTGNSGYATPQFLILLALDVLSWKPDLVILSENINDLIAGYFANFAYDYSHKFSHPYYLNSSAGAQDLAELLADVLLHGSQLYWVTKRTFKRTFPRQFAVHRRSYGDAPNPEALAVFRRNLRSFATLAKANGIQVVLGTQPLEPSEDYFLRHMGFKSYNKVVEYPLHSEFVKHHGAYNAAIKQVGGVERVYVADCASVLGANRDYYVDFVHYSPQGTRALADCYAEFLLTQVKELKGAQ